MKTTTKSMTFFAKLALCAVAAVALMQIPADAIQYTLTDGTSSAVYDPATVGGMTDWNVGGADHLTSQSFWVRRDGIDSSEVSLSQVLLSSSGSGNSAQATFGVANSYEIGVSYVLTELSIEDAQIVESITIKNLSANTLSLNFFQYNNFDLAADMSGDHVRILTDTDGAFSLAQQVQPGVAGISEEAVVQNNPGSVLAEVAYFDTILSKLSDVNIDNLAYTGPVGPGNVEFAFQWQYSLSPGQETSISKIKTLAVTFVPEPGTLVLAVLGFGAIMFSRRRGGRG